MSQPRHTGRGIVVRNAQILLMERWRPELHYFSIPGGGIEAQETAEQAAIREIAEETTIKARVEREVFQMHDGAVQHHIFLCSYQSGEPHLPVNAPEALQHQASNRFRPGWVDIADLHDLDFIYWQPIKQVLIDGLAHGFGDEIVVVSAGTSG